MNHYDEFGLPSTATIEELRQAHKSLARLLHPDQIQDPALRALAESQMKRVNAIFAVLTDPEKRREYDESLAPPRAAMSDGESSGWRDRMPSRDTMRRGAIWGLATVAGIAGLWWFLGEGVTPAARGAAVRQPAIAAPEVDRRRTAAPPPSRPAGEARSPVDETRELRLTIERLQSERDAALSQLARLHARAVEPLPPVPLVPPVAAARVSPSTVFVKPAPIVEKAAAPAPTANPSKLAGKWIYVPAAAGGRDPYPAEHIELVVTEEEGRLTGRYQGRYRVANRPISPEVSFQFEGRTGDSRFIWTGHGGASGAVELELKDALLVVNWWTSRLGGQSTLTSGTATLVRRGEP